MSEKELLYIDDALGHFVNIDEFFHLVDEFELIVAVVELDVTVFDVLDVSHYPLAVFLYPSEFIAGIVFGVRRSLTIISSLMLRFQ